MRREFADGRTEERLVNGRWVDTRWVRARREAFATARAALAALDDEEDLARLGLWDSASAAALAALRRVAADADGLLGPLWYESPLGALDAPHVNGFSTADQEHRESVPHPAGAALRDSESDGDRARDEQLNEPGCGLDRNNSETLIEDVKQSAAELLSRVVADLSNALSAVVQVLGHENSPSSACCGGVSVGATESGGATLVASADGPAASP